MDSYDELAAMLPAFMILSAISSAMGFAAGSNFNGSFLAGSVAATTAFGTTMGITLIGIDFLSKGKFLPAIVREFSKHNS